MCHKNIVSTTCQKPGIQSRFESSLGLGLGFKRSELVYEFWVSQLP